MDAKTEPTPESVLAILERADYRPQTQAELLHRMQLERGQREIARDAIRSLIDSGRAVRLSRGRIAAATGGDRVRGRLQRHPDGFGFVIPETGGEDVFVARRDVGAAMSGDKVEVRLTRRRGGGRVQGVIVATLERRSRRALGVFREREASGVVLPFDPAVGSEIFVPASFRMGAAERDVVEVQLLRGGDGRRPAEGKVLHVLGRFGTPGLDIDVVIRRFELRHAFPPDVVAAARKLPARIPPSAKRARTRFDDPPPVTIDGETAQDFDDAIAVEERPKGEGYRLYVHIADVAHFVAPGDALDLEAASRGTSVYFPGRVLPMLPEKLSNDLCSLRPGVDRLVHTVIMDLDRNGDLQRTRFADGVIRSAARLTYTQVATFFDGGRQARGVPERVAPMLRVAKRLHATLEERRRLRGGLDIDLPEPQILLDVEGAVTGITIEPRNRAHQLIEECMILANEAVAGWLAERRTPCMYRNHESPDPFKLAQLAEFAESLGFTFEFDKFDKSGKSDKPDRSESEALDPRALRELLDSVGDRPERRVLSMVVLRSMQQARYAMGNIGHFGLASPAYCHFTSPIRRYPDLIVHRLLRAARHGAASDAVPDGLDAVAESATEREKNAEAAEREVLAWKKVAFMVGREGETFDSVVTGVARFGVFVQLVDVLVEGMVRVELLGDERFDFDAGRMRLVGERSGRAIRLGDALRVRIDRVDPILRRIDLSPVGAGAGVAEDDQRSAPAETAEGSPRGSAARRRRQERGRKAGSRPKRPRGGRR